MSRELFHRYPGNPILTASMWPEAVNTVFNPGVAEHDGQTILLVRVEDRGGISRLCVARSDNGVTDWKIENDAGLEPQTDGFAERWGVEDPRITKCDGQFMITYTGFSLGGPLVCLASTKDFVTFERHGVILPPEDKDAALFPVQFDGRWALLHRPVPNYAQMGAHIWLSFSPDLRHWGDTTLLLAAERGGMWDAGKIGLSPPPMRTDHGWLLCYHGVKSTAAGSIYRLGLALLDLNDPTKVLARGNEWIFGPNSTYEQSGDVPNVVFPGGWLLEPDGDTIRMYYGAADTSIALATASLTELLDHLHRHRR
jgi:predicted GH43/DUF377 family glycosyl hydrolase